MSRFPEFAAYAVAALLLAAGTASAQDAGAGEKLFVKCKACHTVGDGATNKVGPHLNDLFGRTAGTADGYRYSPAMSKAGADGLVWSEETLRSFLAAPRNFVKGTKMAFPGFKKDQELADMIAYLSRFSTDADAADEEPAEQETDAGSSGPKDEAAAGQAAPPAPAPGGKGDGLNYGLGRIAEAEEIAAWDIDVRPDGLGLPEGRGTVADGMTIYDENCAVCHGDFGEAIGRWPVLAGGHGTLQNERPEKTVGSYWPYLSTVYDYVRRAMPFGDARSLSDDDVYALTAYILYLNDVVTDEDFELSKENLASVRLPNEDNFVPDDRASEPHYADRAEPCMSDCRPGKAEITMHAAILDVTPEDTGDDEAPAGGID